MKKILLCLFLSLFALSKPIIANETAPEQFKEWWLTFRDSASIPQELRVMEDYFVSSALLNDCSKFWLFLNKMNIEQIAASGYENFKQTVACNYFTWVVDSSHGYGKNLFQEGTDFLQTVPISELVKKHAFFNEDQSLQYNQTTAMFYHYLMKNGAGPFLEMLEEPPLGNPPSITIEGKSLSQDVLNSLLEFLSIAKHQDLSAVSTILEVGAGSGRTAFCFLQLMPGVKYIIVDIPPALYLSQTYLSDAFSKRKIFHFRPFEHFSDIQAEFAAADIIFLTPDQLPKLPTQSIDLFMAIDCLHEMKTQEVQFYFNEADRLASLFYFKCWKSTVVPFDNISYTMGNYPVPPLWQKIFEGDCFVPSDFFHAFYRTK